MQEYSADSGNSLVEDNDWKDTDTSVVSVHDNPYWKGRMWAKNLRIQQHAVDPTKPVICTDALGAVASAGHLELPVAPNDCSELTPLSPMGRPELPLVAVEPARELVSANS